MAKKDNKYGFTDFLADIINYSACAAFGALLGAGQYYYKKIFVPHTEAKEDDGSDVAEGRNWVRNNVLKQDIFTLSNDHLQLHAAFVKSPDPDSHLYAVCLHGHSDSGEDAGVYASHYYKQFGMNVLLPDMRGYGSSEGSVTGLGLLESRDLLRWIKYIIDMDEQAQIVLHGVSMGAAAALMATGLRLPFHVKACISDCAYTSVREELRWLYDKKRQLPIPESFLMFVLRCMVFVRAHYDINKVSCEKAILHSVTPTLFIHGVDDDFVPAEMMPRLYESAGCRKDFLWIRRAGHMEAVEADPVLYWKKTDAFVKSCLDIEA